MVRITLYLALILLTIAGVAWMADHPGDVTIQFQGIELYTSFAALSLAIALLMLFASLMLYLWIWLRTDAPLFGRNRIYKRQRQGFDYLNQSMLALAAGDTSRARRLVSNAKTLLPPQPMVQLIAAEAATRDGDHTAAAEHYRELEQDDKARFLGLRGLIGEARRIGRSAEALRLARQALGENKKSQWATETIFQLEIASGDWNAATLTLKSAAKLGLFDDKTTKSHRAALLYAQSIEEQMAGDIDSAKKSLTQALKDRPGFTSAADRLARAEYVAGKTSQAEKLLTAAYTNSPHPELIASLLHLNPTVSDNAWRDKLKKLTATQQDHNVSLLALAEAELACGHTKECHRLLESLLQTAPTRAAWRLMAHLIDAEGGDSQQARDKSNSAPADPSWECDSCGQNLTAWLAICPSCDGFDCISWGDHTESHVRASRASTQSHIPITLLEENVAPPPPAEG